MANKFFINGGVDNNWGTAGNWASTTGGAHTSETVPTSSDNVTIDANSPNCTVNASSRVCQSLTIGNGYANTFTMNQQLSSSGAVSIGTAVIMAGSGLLRQIAAGTWTTNGRTLPWPIEIGGTTTFTSTLAGTLTTSSSLALTNTTSTIFSGAFAIVAASATISGSQTITMVNDFTISGLTTISDDNILNGVGKAWITGGLTTTGNLSGTAVVRFSGTGTWTGAAGSLSNTASFNGAGTTTLSGNILYDTGTLSYVAGTISAGTSVLRINGSCTLNTSGMTWANISLFANNPTVTMTSNVNVSDTTTSANVALLQGSFNWNTASLTMTASLSRNANTPIVVLTGGGTWSGSGVVGTNLTFAGNSTISGSVAFGASGTVPTLLWTSGTITVTSSTLTIANNSAIFNLSGSSCPLNNVTFGFGTLTLNSALILNGTFLVNSGSTVMAGSFGFTVSTLTLSSTNASVDFKLVAGVTYNVTSALTSAVATSGGVLHSSILSATASSSAFLVLSSSATQDLAYTDATDIDSSSGQPIYSFKATLLRTVNWKTQFGPVTTASAFVS